MYFFNFAFRGLIMEILSSPFIFLWILPLVINYFLAKSRGKNVALMLVLTLFFSWIITISLSCMQLVADRYSPELIGNTCPDCHRQYRSEDLSCIACHPDDQLVAQPAFVHNSKSCKKCGRQNRINDFACFACKTILPSLS
jgi:hypothetical protein